MVLKFYKYEGAGNDFILLDNREDRANLQEEEVKKLCDRHFGVGADGLLLLNKALGYDFKMTYFNSDGLKADMCGNGGRCMVAFARKLEVIDQEAHFLAGDGEHQARILPDDTVELKMRDVSGVRKTAVSAIINTGVPHFVKYVDHLDRVNVREEGSRIRHSPEFEQEGINVDFIEFGQGGLRIRTYERGVEDETLACGTGITAAAIAAAGHANKTYSIPVVAMGGALKVRYDKIGDQQFTNIWLCGPASFVFEGSLQIS